MRLVAGGIIIIFGLQLTGLLRLPILFRERRLELGRQVGPAYLRSFLLGIAFSLGWTPCVTLVLSGILGLTLASATIQEGVRLLGFYSLGLAVPFLAMALALTSATRLIKRLGRSLGIVTVASGGLLVLLGILVMTNQLVVLNRYFTFFSLR